MGEYEINSESNPWNDMVKCHIVKKIEYKNMFKNTNTSINVWYALQMKSGNIALKVNRLKANIAVNY